MVETRRDIHDSQADGWRHMQDDACVEESKRSGQGCWERAFPGGYWHQWKLTMDIGWGLVGEVSSCIAPDTIAIL